MHPTPSKPKTKETVNGINVMAFVLALLLCVPMPVSAAPLRAIDFPPKNITSPPICSKDTAVAMLSFFVKHDKKHHDGLVVANWYLHPDGFAFQIPEGLVLADKRRRATSLFSSYRDAVSLLDPTDEDNSFQTFLTVSITSEDKRLQTMQREDAVRLFSSQFDRFALVSFTRVLLCGVEGIRMTFLTGRSPRLQVQQCMFEKNGKTYIATIASENNLQALPTAWQQFDTFYRTLFFLEDVSP